MAQLTQSLTAPVQGPVRRFRVILRGDGFLTDAGAERSGFYVVRTTLAENETLAGKLALFDRSEEHTSELQSLMRTSYAVFCLKKKKHKKNRHKQPYQQIKNQ